MYFFRFVAEEKHFRKGYLYITCIASISDVWQATADDAAHGILGNITQQTNQIVIGASPSKLILSLSNQWENLASKKVNQI